MHIKNNIIMAINAIKSAKWRSLLTMLGVIIGVMSVVVIVSIGEGVKKQMTNQVLHTGKDLITVRGGQVAERDENGKFKDVDILTLFAGANLSEKDFETIMQTKNTSLVSPFTVIAGVPLIDGKKSATSTSIIATNEQAPQALNQKLLYGGFFEDDEGSKAVAVIGKKTAEVLFRENVPIGRSFELRGQKIVVIGVFSEFEASPFTPGVDYNRAIFLPYEFAKKLVDGPLQPYQVLVRPISEKDTTNVVQDIRTGLTKSHGGQEDFTVLQAEDNLVLANGVLSLLTNLVSAVAAVSLIVGGIGIMNIMLVAVSERTHEIGIRKSVGATNRQIMFQFMIEAVILSGVGGILGVIFSLLANYFIRLFTSLEPVITLPIMWVAVGVALLVGVVFGVTPALKAARKDPINALRRI